MNEREIIKTRLRIMSEIIDSKTLDTTQRKEIIKDMQKLAFKLRSLND